MKLKKKKLKGMSSKRAYGTIKCPRKSRTRADKFKLRKTNDVSVTDNIE